jgi:uncharacterized protein (TIGR02284 family)
METEKIDAINSVIVINHDREEGYKRASEDVKDEELKKLFLQFSGESARFSEELRRFVPNSEEPERDETKNTGKLHRLWMDIKAAVTGDQRGVILSSCEFGEDHAKKTYEDALAHPEELPLGAHEVLTKQRAAIQKSHDLVKSLRDAEKNK